MTPFSITPIRCEVTYACTGVARQGELTSSVSCNDLTFDATTGSFTITTDSSDYESGEFTPGTYTVTISGTANGSSPSESDTTTMSFTLVDPCDPPISVTSSALVD